MDVATIYSVRQHLRAPLPDAIADIIAKLKISFKPAFKRPFAQKRREPEIQNWRETALLDVVRKVRERDDVDYDEISAAINKLTKQSYAKLMGDSLARLDKRDAMFRLRVTTLLFDRGVRQPFFAPMMADAYVDIAKLHPDALNDLAAQVSMFDTLYDASKVISVPNSNDPGYDEAVIAWTKQKEVKRGFAVYVVELYTRKLVQEATMMGFLKTVMDELKESVTHVKTSINEEHVDALVRFIFAVSAKIPMRGQIVDILAIPRTDAPSLTMKSRFKLEDAQKASR